MSKFSRNRQDTPDNPYDDVSSEHSDYEPPLPRRPQDEIETVVEAYDTELESSYSDEDAIQERDEYNVHQNVGRAPDSQGTAYGMSQDTREIYEKSEQLRLKRGKEKSTDSGLQINNRQPDHHLSKDREEAYGSQKQQLGKQKQIRQKSVDQQRSFAEATSESSSNSNSETETSDDEDTPKRGRPTTLLTEVPQITSTFAQDSDFTFTPPSLSEFILWKPRQRINYEIGVHPLNPEAPELIRRIRAEIRTYTASLKGIKLDKPKLDAYSTRAKYKLSTLLETNLRESYNWDEDLTRRYINTILEDNWSYHNKKIAKKRKQKRAVRKATRQRQHDGSSSGQSKKSRTLGVHHNDSQMQDMVTLNARAVQERKQSKFSGHKHKRKNAVSSDFATGRSNYEEETEMHNAPLQPITKAQQLSEEAAPFIYSVKRKQDTNPPIPSTTEKRVKRSDGYNRPIIPPHSSPPPNRMSMARSKGTSNGNLIADSQLGFEGGMLPQASCSKVKLHIRGGPTLFIKRVPTLQLLINKLEDHFPAEQEFNFDSDVLFYKIREWRDGKPLHATDDINKLYDAASNGQRVTVYNGRYHGEFNDPMSDEGLKEIRQSTEEDSESYDHNTTHQGLNMATQNVSSNTTEKVLDTNNSFPLPEVSPRKLLALSMKRKLAPGTDVDLGPVAEYHSTDITPSAPEPTHPGPPSCSHPQDLQPNSFSFLPGGSSARLQSSQLNTLRSPSIADTGLASPTEDAKKAKDARMHTDARVVSQPDHANFNASLSQQPVLRKPSYPQMSIPGQPIFLPHSGLSMANRNNYQSPEMQKSQLVINDTIIPSNIEESTKSEKASSTSYPENKELITNVTTNQSKTNLRERKINKKASHGSRLLEQPRQSRRTAAQGINYNINKLSHQQEALARAASSEQTKKARRRQEDTEGGN